ncbi:hypothetical protein GCM10009795_040120 [Nocardioides hankookensis]|uniref:ATP-binding protein n=1 Tax=Nocardioides hankookensis TaxID=443157 RepID=A0ABW1LRF3_9ACTN
MITLVCGPPCAGKTTHVRANAQPGDLVLDVDRLAQQCGSDRTHNHKQTFRDQAEVLMESYLDELEAAEHTDAWVIRTCPDPDDRAELAARIHADEVIVLIEDQALLLQRALERHSPEHTIRIINWWFKVYEPSDVDDLTTSSTATVPAALLHHHLNTWTGDAPALQMFED